LSDAQSVLAKTIKVKKWAGETWEASEILANLPESMPRMLAKSSMSVNRKVGFTYKTSEVYQVFRVRLRKSKQGQNLPKVIAKTRNLRKVCQPNYGAYLIVQPYERVLVVATVFPSSTLVKAKST